MLNRVRVAVLAWTIVMATRAGRSSLWGDEGFTAQSVRLNWGPMIRQLAHVDVNMTVHYVVLKAWTTVAGTSEFALRMPSLLAVAAAALVFHAWVERRWGCGTVATALLLFNPFVARVAITARPYGLLLLFAVLAMVLLDRALESNRARDWALWTLIAIAGLYTHLTMVLLLAGMAIAAVAIKRRLTSSMIVAGFTTGAAMLPTALLIAPKNTLGWLPPASLHELVRVMIRTQGGPLLAPVMIVLSVIGLWGLRNRSWPVGLAATAIVPWVFVVAMLPIQSLLIDTYLVVATPAVTILAAVGLQRFRLAKPVVVAVAVVSLLGIAVRHPTLAPQDWRGATALLDRSVQPGDAVAFPSCYYRIVAEYYSGAWERSLPLMPSQAWGTASPYALDRINRLHLLASSDLGEPARVWIGGTPDDQVTNDAIKWLTAKGWKAEHHDLNGVMIVLLTR